MFEANCESRRSRSAAKKRGRRRGSLLFERLESRVVFDGGLGNDVLLKGTMFYDQNGNAQRDVNEQGLSGWTVYLDDNDNGIFDTGERSTQSDQQGKYEFTIPPYLGAIVRAQVQPGWEQVFPSSGAHYIAGTLGGTFDGLDFGNRVSDPTYFSTIRGVKWHDQDHDGNRDDGEPGLLGWQVYLDQNDNNVLDMDERWTFTDAQGAYQFSGVVPGNYIVREVMQAGWTQAYPTDGRHAVAAGARNVVSNVNFGNYVSQGGDIRGKKWSDANGNGQQEPGEPGLPGWLIFIDQNLNGRFDTTEPSMTTDADGNYAFTDVPLGRQVIGEAQPDVWRQQFPGLRVGFTPAPLQNVLFAPINAGVAAKDVQAGDLNGDGNLDLAVFDPGRGMLATLNNLGVSRFESPQEMFVGKDVKYTLFSDVDGDNDLDLVTFADQAATVATSRLIRVDTYRNNGLGVLVRAESAAVEGILDFGTLADINNDNRPDVVLTRFVTPNDLGTDFVTLLNNGTGQFSVSENRLLPETDSGAIVSLDITGDGLVDRVVADVANQQIAIFINDGNGQFRPPVLRGVGQAPIFIVLGDLNRDNFRDIVVSNRDSGDLSVFLNNRDGTFLAEQRYGTGLGAPAASALGDFDGDGSPDIVVTNGNTDNVAIFFNNGAGAFGSATTYATGTTPLWVATGDWDRDNDLDLVVANGASNNLTFLVNDGHGLFTSGATASVGTSPSFVVSGLLNPDLHLDLIVSTGDGLQRLLNNGDGSFGPATPYISDRVDRSLWSSDMTGDGFVDLLRPRERSRSISLWANNGQGYFFESKSIDVDGRAGSLVIGDWNRDGKNDFITSYLDSTDLGVYFNNGNGTFTAGTPISLGQSLIDMVTKDMDGDGDVDLLVTTADDNVSLYSNNGSGLFTRSSTIPATDAGALVTGDWNGDGHEDFATSLGGNSLGMVLNDLIPDYRQRADVTSGGSVDDQNFGNQKLSWRNATKPLDVDNDSFVAPLDALIIINFLNRNGSQLLTTQTPFTKPFLDPSGDDFIAPNDALMVINFLNRPPGGEGEAAAALSSISASDAVVIVAPPTVPTALDTNVSSSAMTTGVAPVRSANGEERRSAELPRLIASAASQAADLSTIAADSLASQESSPADSLDDLVAALANDVASVWDR